MSEHDLSWYQAQPEKYRILSNGTVLDLEKVKTGKGGFVAAFPEHNPHAITKETAQTLNAKRKAQGLRSHMLGLVDAARVKGLDLPDPDTLSEEELIQAAGDAKRLMVKHTLLTYLASGNLRGMGEIFPKLDPFTSDEAERGRAVHINNLNMPAFPSNDLLEIFQLLDAARQTNVDKARALEGEEVIDVIGPTPGQAPAEPET